MAGSKPKSVAQQLFEAQQRRAAHKAALEKAARAAEEKEKRAAARREAAAARQAQRAAEDLARRQQAADARQVQQVLREMEKRETLRQQAEARESQAREREAAREEKDRAVQGLKDEAARRTRDVERRVQAIASILTDRDRDLEWLREDTSAALANSSGRGDGGAAPSDSATPADTAEAAANNKNTPAPNPADPYTTRITKILAARSFLKKAHPEAAYSPENRRLTIAIDLPRREGIPTEKSFRYAPAQGEIIPLPRPEADIRRIYQDAVARLALCVADYAAAITTPAAVDVIAVNGFLPGTDPATGRPARPCLVSLIVTRDVLAQVALDEPSLDPVRCLHHLKAVISPDPYGLQPVTPFIAVEAERRQAAAATGTPEPELPLNLLTMNPYDFESLIRDLFLAMGFTAWRTPDSHDGGLDAIAIREDIAIGGVCVIQAKRYTHTVPVEAVRALYGTMQEQKAYTGLVVTTSSFGPASHAFAREVGRITLIDGVRLVGLLKEYLGMDAFVSGRRSARS